MIPQIVVPKENLFIYERLFIIEVGLREFIIEILGNKFEELWWKTRLPPDVLKTYREGRDYERRIKWCECVPHHPLYYIEFPDLKKIIQRSDNWRDVFEPIFKNKEVFLSSLTELEPIRNKIAHNRKTSKSDKVVVDACYEIVSVSLGDSQLLKLAARCTVAADISTQISELRTTTERYFALAKKCEPIECSPAHEIMKSWWFDKDYLGSSIAKIDEYFDILANYSNLPRPRGSGHTIAAWLKQTKIDETFALAMQEFSKLLDQGRGT